jgi:hypothetical protein
MAERKLKKSIQLSEKVKEKFGCCEELRFELMKPQTDYAKEALESKLRSAEMAAGKAQEAVDAYAKAYHRATNKTLPRLGRILASFRTGTFKEILRDYKSVSVP